MTSLSYLLPHYLSFTFKLTSCHLLVIFISFVYLVALFFFFFWVISFGLVCYIIWEAVCSGLWLSSSSILTTPNVLSGKVQNWRSMHLTTGEAWFFVGFRRFFCISLICLRFGKWMIRFASHKTWVSIQWSFNSSYYYSFFFSLFWWWHC